MQSDLPFQWHVIAMQKSDNGALSTPTKSTNPHAFPRLNIEVDIVQHLGVRSCWIRESHIPYSEAERLIGEGRHRARVTQRINGRLLADRRQQLAARSAGRRKRLQVRRYLSDNKRSIKEKKNHSVNRTDST